MSFPDTEAAKVLRATLAQQLVNDGYLRSPEWHRAVEETPRHVYVPIFYHQVNRMWESVTSDAPGYFDAVYSDRSLTTQVTDRAATSSSSQPSLMIEMLEALGVEDGDSVGEVATGTGYNGGLICHRVGGKNLITLEVDEKLSRLAKARLGECGYSPVVVAGDARDGFPGNPTLDRVIVTCGFDTFPYAIAQSVRRGGVIVCPLGWGNARLLVGRNGALEGQFLAGGSYFMKARAEGSSGGVPYPHDPGPVEERTAEIDHSLLEGEGFRFVQSLALGEFGAATEMDDNGSTTGYRVWARDGSWAHVEGSTVRQAGPHHLWDAIEVAHSWFESHGRPARDRFGATITPEKQFFWLDEREQLLPTLP